MDQENHGSVYLQRIDCDCNMRRFYAASVEPTLFGGASVIRCWGRIGTTGRDMMETFDNIGEAQSALNKLIRRKRRRGYSEPA